MRTDPSTIVFENVWQKNEQDLFTQVVEIWRQYPAIDPQTYDKRLRQLAYIAKTADHKIIAITTAYKVYIKQLGNFFYVYRCLVTPGYNLPGLDSKITALTRDFLETFSAQEQSDAAAGLFTVVENEKLKGRDLAVWPSGFVYIGQSKDGHHLRVCYFKGARINYQTFSNND